MYITTIDEARKLCSDERTSARNWFLCFYTKVSYYSNHDGKKRLDDNGGIKAIADELGVKLSPFVWEKDVDFEYLEVE